MEIKIAENLPEERETLANPNDSSDFWFEPVSQPTYAGKPVNEDSSLRFSVGRDVRL